MTLEEESGVRKLTKMIAYESDPGKLKVLAAELVDLLAQDFTGEILDCLDDRN